MSSKDISTKDTSSKEEIKQQQPIVVEEKDYAWKKEQESILKKWADKASCFKMMHERAYKRFWCLNAWFNIPVIILSTITGAGNVASTSFVTEVPYIPYIIGSMNILAGILATIATYTGVAQKLEAHRYSSVAWDKFSRKLQIELSKSRKDRAKAKDFIKNAALEYDRLIEMSPILPNDVIRWFSKMVDTGEYEEEIGACAQCCFEWVCFPCGCSYCNCLNLLCCSCKSFIKYKSQDQIDKDRDTKAAWKLIEVPEIIGRIKPTEIAPESMPETPLVIIEQPQQKESKNNDENLYDIYNNV
jgi:hypothetical protein